MTEGIARPPSGVSRFVKEPFPGLSHGLGALLALVGLLCLVLTPRGGAAAVAGVAIYGVCLILLFTASSLAHSVFAGPRTNDILDRCDHAAIFLLIAGTYTPICLTTLGGAGGGAMLVAQWAMALLGAVMVLKVGPRKQWVALYLPMGWAVVTVIGPLWERMETPAMACLIAGGVVYTLGGGGLPHAAAAALAGAVRARTTCGTYWCCWRAGLHFATVWRITAA
jgi:hemolysin III